MEITKERIKQDLIKIGLKQGQIVGVHSSLKSIGQVIGGAETVIDALLEVVGEEGTIIMPTFTSSTAIGDTLPFSLKETPSNTGLITEVFRKRKNAVRSFHPTHAATAIGKEAFYLTSNHMQTSALGIDSPFHKLSQKGGYILLLGVDNRVNSLIHVSEVLAKVPYLNIPVYNGEKAKILKENGELKIVSLTETPGDSRQFNKLNPFLFEKNIIREGIVGQAKSYLIKASDVLEVACEQLKKDPFFFLCHNPKCNACINRWKAFSR